MSVVFCYFPTFKNIYELFLKWQLHIYSYITPTSLTVMGLCQKDHKPLLLATSLKLAAAASEKV